MITTNTSHIINHGYPSSSTASTTATGTWSFSDVCQLWLDFQQFDGFALLSHATGACEDIFAVAGQSAISTPKSNDTELKKIWLFLFIIKFRVQLSPHVKLSTHVWSSPHVKLSPNIHSSPQFYLSPHVLSSTNIWLSPHFQSSPHIQSSLMSNRPLHPIIPSHTIVSSCHLECMIQMIPYTYM